MKKKLYVTFVTGLIASCLLFLLSVTAGFPFFSGLPKTNVVSAEAVETVDAADAVYTFSATTPASSSPVVIGPNRQVDLQDGESVVMQFTIVSCTFSYYTDGILVSKRNGVPTSNPMSSTGAIGWIHNGGAADFSGKVGEGEAAFTRDTVGNGATIFAAGNTVRATFTPMQSQTELGVFTIEYKTAGSDDWVLGAKASGLGESFGRNAQIWLFFSVNAAGSASITLTDYTITTTYGANLLDSEDGREAENANNNGQWVYDTLGLAYVHRGSTYTAKAEQTIVDVACKDTIGGYYVLAPKAEIPEGSKLVQQFEIVDGFDGNTQCFGLGLYYATNAYFDGGIIFQARAMINQNVIRDFGWSGKGSLASAWQPINYMKKGSIIRLEYTPYSESASGSIYLYAKNADEADFTAIFSVTGLDNSNNYYRSVLMGIRMYGDTSNPNQSYSFKNFVSYLENLSDETKTELYSTQRNGANGLVTNGVTLTTKKTDVNVSVKENTMSFTGAGKDYTVYVKENGSYKLPKPTVEGATFIGWKDGEKLYKAGTDVSISENKVYSAVILRDWETVGAAVSVNEFMGLRFESTFNTEDYANASGFISEYGTLIARVGDIGTANDLTVSTNAAVKKITSTVTYSEKDGKTTYAGGISRLRVHNYDVEIVGCGYMVVNYESGAETVYTSVIVRTAKGIAEQCLSDNVYIEDDFEYKVLQAYIDGEEFPVEE